MAGRTPVSTAAELVAATQQRAPAIEVDGVVRGMPMLTLAPGVRLRGGTLEFGAKGVRLTRDNVLEDVTIRTPEHEVAICNDTQVGDLGTLTLRRVRTSGQVLLLARDASGPGTSRWRGLWSRPRPARPRRPPARVRRGGDAGWLHPVQPAARPGDPAHRGAAGP